MYSAAKLGAANWVIGLMPALLNAGPQVFVAPCVAWLPVNDATEMRVGLGLYMQAGASARADTLGLKI